MGGGRGMLMVVVVLVLGEAEDGDAEREYGGRREGGWRFVCSADLVAIAAKEAGKHYFPPLCAWKGRFARQGKAGFSTWQRRLEGCGGRAQSEVENDCASFST